MLESDVDRPETWLEIADDRPEVDDARVDSEPDTPADWLASVEDSAENDETTAETCEELAELTSISDELTAVTDEIALDVTVDWLPRATAVDDIDDEMLVVLRLMRCTTELRLTATRLETEVLTLASELLIWLCVELMVLTDVLVLLSEELIWLWVELIVLTDTLVSLSEALIWLSEVLASLSDALIWLVETRPLLKSNDKVETLDASDEISLEIDDEASG